LKVIILTSGWGNNKYIPIDFTKQRVVMLLSLLNKKKLLKYRLRIISISLKSEYY